MDPVVIVGGAALALWLLLSGKKDEPAPEPAPPPPPPGPPPTFDPAIGTAKEPFKYVADAEAVGIKDGYAAGIYDAKNGLPMNPKPPMKYTHSQLQAKYQAAYITSYNQGYGETKSTEDAAKKSVYDGYITEDEYNARVTGARAGQVYTTFFTWRNPPRVERYRGPNRGF